RKTRPERRRRSQYSDAMPSAKPDPFAFFAPPSSKPSPESTMPTPPRHDRITPSSITPEAVVRDRRRWLGLLTAAPLLGLAGCADAGEDAPPVVAAPAAPASPGDPFRTSEPQTRFEDA